MRSTLRMLTLRWRLRRASTPVLNALGFVSIAQMFWGRTPRLIKT